MDTDDKESPAREWLRGRADRQETSNATSHKKPRPARVILRLHDLRDALARVHADAQTDILSDDVLAALDDDGGGER